MNFHTPVLLKESLGYLKPRKGDLFIDATVGGGGYAKALIENGAKVLGIDRDPEAIAYLKHQNLKNLVLENGNFSQITEIAKKHGFTGVAGIVFDLGVSSHQLESAKRGFSFKNSGPLDMRMDPVISIKASDIVNNFERKRLDEIFKNYGQEKFSWSIAGAVCRARQIKPIETTGELAQLAREVYAENRFNKRAKGLKTGLKPVDPATKIFQALRIVVNSELLNLEESLPQTVSILGKNGRLVVVSFHSLEDGIVKRFFKENKGFSVITKKPIGPSAEEVKENPRSRSAKLRAAERII